MSNNCSNNSEIIELNVGGVHYTTKLSTLLSEKNSLLYEIFSKKSQKNDNDDDDPTSTTTSSSSSAIKILKDSKGRIFLDRDGVLFRYILDYLRDKQITLPEGFRELIRLKKEAEYYKLANMIELIRTDAEMRQKGCITIGYRGSFQFGKDGLADVKFRKLSRILVCGRVALCRDVFGDTLNESRDPDHGGPDRYTSRFFLKHCFIEQAFDMLHEHGFRLAASCGSGTAGSVAEPKPGVDAEENRWNHYNEFVFIRD